MFKAVPITLWVLVILFTFTAPLWCQQSAEDIKKNAYKHDPEALQIIKRIEAKMYSPLEAGLKDIRFIQQMGLDRSYRTLWFKAPDQVRGEFGRPDRGVTDDKKPKMSGSKVIEVPMLMTEIVARKTIAKILGRPISCFIPYGRFEIVSKDSSGGQLRFTMNLLDSDNFFWTNIDFYYDQEYRLTKIMEKMPKDGRVEEHRIKLKPYKDGEELLVFDEILTIAGTEKWQTASRSIHYYVEEGPFLVLDRIVREIPKESKVYKEFYTDYKINKGLEESLFKK